MSTSALPETDPVAHAANLEPVEPEELTFHFLADRLCLDLVATIGERWRRTIERLRSPDDLARWLREAELCAPPPAVTEAQLVEARRLRNAILAAILSRRDGAPLPPGAVASINEHAARPDLAPQLEGGRRVLAPADTVDPALATLARDAIDLLATVPSERLRECAADDCSLLFVDTSRPGRRRWCSMSGCGNRHKTAAYRRRRQAAPGARSEHE